MRDAFKKASLHQEDNAAMAEIMALMLPLVELTTKLEADKHITMSSVVPLIATLMLQMNACFRTRTLSDRIKTEVGKAFARDLTKGMLHRLACFTPESYDPSTWTDDAVGPEFKSTVKAAVMAMVVDPTRMLDSIPEEKRASVIELYVSQCLSDKTLVDKVKAKIPHDASSTANNRQITGQNCSRGKDGTIRYPKATGSNGISASAVSDDAVKESLKYELKKYLNACSGTAADDWTDTSYCTISGMSALDWWRLNAYNHPIIAYLARKYLAMPASSASSERLFKTGSLNLSKKRRRLSSRNLRSSMMLAHISRRFWRRISGISLDNCAKSKRVVQSDDVTASHVTHVRMATLYRDVAKIREHLPILLFDPKDLPSIISDLEIEDEDQTASLMTALCVYEDEMNNEFTEGLDIGEPEEPISDPVNNGDTIMNAEDGNDVVDSTSQVEARAASESNPAIEPEMSDDRQRKRNVHQESDNVRSVKKTRACRAAEVMEDAAAIESEAPEVEFVVEKVTSMDPKRLVGVDQNDEATFGIPYNCIMVTYKCAGDAGAVKGNIESLIERVGGIKDNNVEVINGSLLDYCINTYFGDLKDAQEDQQESVMADRLTRLIKKVTEFSTDAKLPLMSQFIKQCSFKKFEVPQVGPASVELNSSGVEGLNAEAAASPSEIDHSVMCKQ